MPEDNENTYFDEDTLKKVYEGLLAAGVFGQQAVDAVNQIQNRKVLFREAKPKRRGRPPKPATEEQGMTVPTQNTDAWATGDSSKTEGAN